MSPWVGGWILHIGDPTCLPVAKMNFYHFEKDPEEALS